MTAKAPRPPSTGRRMTFEERSKEPEINPVGVAMHATGLFLGTVFVIFKLTGVIEWDWFWVVFPLLPSAFSIVFTAAFLTAYTLTK